MTWEKFKSFFNGAELGDAEVLPCILEAVRANLMVRNVYDIRESSDFAELITERHQDLRTLANLLIVDNVSWIGIDGNENHYIISDTKKLNDELKEYQTSLEKAIEAIPSDFADFMDVDKYLDRDKRDTEINHARLKILADVFAKTNGIEPIELEYNNCDRLENGFTIIRCQFISRNDNESYNLAALSHDDAIYIPVDVENEIIAHAMSTNPDLWGTFFRRTTDDDCETIVVFDYEGHEHNLGTLADAHHTMLRIKHNEGCRQLVYLDSNPTNLVYAFRGELGKFYHAEYGTPTDLEPTNVYELEGLRFQ